MGNLDALALVLVLGLRGLAGTGVLDADPWRPEGESVRRTCRSERQAMLCSVETCLLAVLFNSREERLGPCGHALTVTPWLTPWQSRRGGRALVIASRSE